MMNKTDFEDRSSAFQADLSKERSNVLMSRIVNALRTMQTLPSPCIKTNKTLSYCVTTFHCSFTR